MKTWPKAVHFLQAFSKTSLSLKRSFSTTKNITSCHSKALSKELCKSLIGRLKRGEIAGPCHDFHSTLLFPTLIVSKNSAHDGLAKKHNSFFLFRFPRAPEQTVCSYQFPSNVSRHPGWKTRRAIQASWLANIKKACWTGLFGADLFLISNNSSLHFCNETWALSLLVIYTRCPKAVRLPASKNTAEHPLFPDVQQRSQLFSELTFSSSFWARTLTPRWLAKDLAATSSTLNIRQVGTPKPAAIRLAVLVVHHSQHSSTGSNCPWFPHKEGFWMCLLFGFHPPRQLQDPLGSSQGQPSLYSLQPQKGRSQARTASYCDINENLLYLTALQSIGQASVDALFLQERSTKQEQRWCRTGRKEGRRETIAW